MKIQRFSFGQLSKALKGELRKEVFLNFPDVRAFKTRFYYQIPPNYIFIARVSGVVVGQRYLTDKTRNIDGKKYKIAGIGITVKKEFQGKGLGQQLTRTVLQFCKENKYDIAMATTKNKIAAHILKKYGFHKMRRKMRYKDIDTRKTVTETYDVFVRDFNDGKVIRQIDRGSTPIYMGIGSW